MKTRYKILFCLIIFAIGYFGTILAISAPWDLSTWTRTQFEYGGTLSTVYGCLTSIFITTFIAIKNI